VVDMSNNEKTSLEWVQEISKKYPKENAFLVSLGYKYIRKHYTHIIYLSNDQDQQIGILGYSSDDPEIVLYPPTEHMKFFHFSTILENEYTIQRILYGEEYNI
jgi:hypothetical protein